MKKNLVTIDQSGSDGQLSFSSLNKKAFEPKCLHCHNGGQAPNFSSYSTLMASGAVVAGSSLGSLVYTRIADHSMPTDSTLSDQEIQNVRTWIDAGALDDQVAPTNLTYADSAPIYTVGVVTTPDVPSNDGGPIASYSVSPNLPSGLVLDPATGEISGTPTSAVDTTNYVVTGSNIYGSDSTTLAITVALAAPDGVIYSANSASYVTGTAITPNTPSSSGGQPSSYTISPALPAGLSLDPVTGAITGTPTVAQSATSYTVTASNGAGSTSAAITISITSNVIAPTGLSYSTKIATYTKGVKITTNAPTMTTGSLPVTYSISSALPSGLVFNTSTGMITGKATVLADKKSYTVTATNSAGNTSSNINITVNDAAPTTLAYTSMSPVYTSGIAIAQNAPTSKGGAVVSYSVSPALPAGLTLNKTTGVISGTPTAAMPVATYTVTATNTGGSTTAAISITVQQTNTNATFTFVSDQVLKTGSPTSSTSCVFCHRPGGPENAKDMTTYAALMASGSVVAGSAATSPLYMRIIDGTMPPGGAGVPADSIRAIYDWIQMGAMDDRVPHGMSYASAPAAYPIGSSIGTNALAISGLTPFTVAVSPALPAGLSLNTTTGAITGTPTSITAARNYTVTATNTYGSAHISVSIEVTDAAPSHLTYSVNAPVYVTGTAVPTNSPSSQGGAPTSYSISPALPAGLSLNTTTGAITGTPTVVQNATNYVITATNSIGHTTATISIKINSGVVVPSGLSYSLNPAIYTKGTAISANSATVAGGTVPMTFTVSPALPAGLSLNTSTGAITGTPTAITAAKNYTITATNSAGKTTKSVTITVNDAAPSSLTYVTKIATYTVGVAITANTPSNSGGAIMSYSVSPALPAGLTLNSSTGTITGTPTVAAAKKSYVVTGSNSGGHTTVNVSITVLAVPLPSISYPGWNVTTGVYSTGNTVNLTATNSGGAATSWSISPALPAVGLSLNTHTGAITGTVSGSAAASAYTVTATNAGGSKSTTLVLGFSNPANSNFNAVSAILNDSKKGCTGCHDGTTARQFSSVDNYAGLMSDVVAGSPLKSKFFTYVLPVATNLEGAGTMPQNAGALTAAQLQTIQDWISAGADIPVDIPPPGQLITVPTSDAVAGRLLMALGPAGLTAASTNFRFELANVEDALPASTNPKQASGLDKIPLLVYAACSDLNMRNIKAVYGVDTSKALSTQSTALANAGVKMLNNLIGGLATNADVVAYQNSKGYLNAQTIFANLVSAEQTAGDSTAAAFISVCTAAHTYGIEMVGY